MTQQEFDREMHRINSLWMEERAVLENEENRLISERRVLQQQINQLREQYEDLGLQLRETKLAIKRCNIKYHDMKHQHCVDNPKSSMEDGTSMQK